jgi:hypothetical protein
MVYFQTKNPNLDKFWSVLQGNVLANFMVIWYISMSFGIIFGHLVYFVAIWYVVPRKIWQPWFPSVYFGENNDVSKKRLNTFLEFPVIVSFCHSTDYFL